MSARGSQTRGRGPIPTPFLRTRCDDRVLTNAAAVAIDPTPQHACDPQRLCQLFRRPSAAVFSTATPLQRAPSDVGTPRIPTQSLLHAQGLYATFGFYLSGSVCCRL